LKKLPFEVRNEIHNLLVVNPILGQCASNAEKPVHKERVLVREYARYDLWPSILLTCHEVYAKASDVLYGANIFYIFCHGPYRVGVKSIPDLPKVIYLCPLTRYLKSCFSYITKLEEASRISMVRHWRVVVSVSALDSEDNCPSRKFVEFCRTTHRFSLQTLEVIVIRQGLKLHERYTTPQFIRPRYYKVARVELAGALRPLKLFRRLRRLTFKSHHDVHLAIYIFPADKEMDDLQYPQLLPGIELAHKLQTLVTGDASMEPAFAMHAALLSYALAFERYSPFKIEMSLGGHQRGGRQKLDYTYLKVHQDELKVEDWYYYTDSGSWNPFWNHPVENALYTSRIYSDQENILAFKEGRATVLDYLESQHHRIVAAASNFNEFIKEQKRANNTCFWPKEVVSLIEDYVAAFIRNMSSEVKLHIRKHPSRFHKYYAELPRGKLLKKLSSCHGKSSPVRGSVTPLPVLIYRGFLPTNLQLTGASKTAIPLRDSSAVDSEEKILTTMKRKEHYRKISELVKDLVDDLDTQYLEIREGRKHLLN
jgi:hypothetical protein